MASAVGSILRAATRGPDEPLNVLCAPTHERTESNLCRTGHRFWALRGPSVKDWNAAYAAVPENYVLLDPARGEKQLPPEVDFDLVLSQNKAGQYQMLAPLAKALHLPLLVLEHTLPHPSWGPEALAQLKALRGSTNVFISAFSRERWGWAPDEALVVHHGVDTGAFAPGPAERKNHALSVVNAFRDPERRWCCGYDFWCEATEGLPTFHLGASRDGWSRPADGVPGLVQAYREASVFVDTAGASPIPTVVLEAMACGALVVSRGNAMVPEVIEDGVNGFLCPDARQMRARLREVLAAPAAYDSMRASARRTILERFALPRFVADWGRVFRHAADFTFTG